MTSTFVEKAKPAGFLGGFVAGAQFMAGDVWII